jgi:hypothetical protein
MHLILLATQIGRHQVEDALLIVDDEDLGIWHSSPLQRRSGSQAILRPPTPPLLMVHDEG